MPSQTAMITPEQAAALYRFAKKEGMSVREYHAKLLGMAIEALGEPPSHESFAVAKPRKRSSVDNHADSVLVAIADSPRGLSTPAIRELFGWGPVLSGAVLKHLLASGLVVRARPSGVGGVGAPPFVYTLAPKSPEVVP